MMRCAAYAVPNTHAPSAIAEGVRSIAADPASLRKPLSTTQSAGMLGFKRVTRYAGRGLAPVVRGHRARTPGEGPHARHRRRARVRRPGRSGGADADPA